MALPSPTSATTGRCGSASFTPIAAGKPHPIPLSHGSTSMWMTSRPCGIGSTSEGSESVNKSAPIEHSKS